MVSFVASLVAMTSASQEDRAVWPCRTVFQESGPPERRTRKPLRERNLNSSTSVPSGTELPSWEPQHASLYVVSSRAV